MTQFSANLIPFILNKKGLAEPELFPESIKILLSIVPAKLLPNILFIITFPVLKYKKSIGAKILNLYIAGADLNPRWPPISVHVRKVAHNF